MVVRMAFPVIGCVAASGSEHGKRIPGGAKRNGASYSLLPMILDSV
jgi:hypothetical protein